MAEWRWWGMVQREKMWDERRSRQRTRELVFQVSMFSCTGWGLLSDRSCNTSFRSVWKSERSAKHASVITLLVRLPPRILLLKKLTMCLSPGCCAISGTKAPLCLWIKTIASTTFLCPARFSWMKGRHHSLDPKSGGRHSGHALELLGKIAYRHFCWHHSRETSWYVAQYAHANL